MRRVIDDSTISVNGKQIKIVSNRDPLQLPWGEMVRLLLFKFLSKAHATPLRIWVVFTLAVGSVSVLFSLPCDADETAGLQQTCRLSKTAHFFYR